MDFNVKVSPLIILQTIAILAAVLFLYAVRYIIAILFVALILTAAIEPAVNWFHRKRVYRPVAVIAVYLIIFVLAGSLISFLVPPLVHQFQTFTKDLPLYREQLSKTFSGLEFYFRAYNIEMDLEKISSSFGQSLTESSGQIFSKTVGLFAGIFSMIVIMSLTFYLSVKKDGIRNFLVSITPAKYQEYVISITDRIKNQIGRWVNGQMILMGVIFVLDYVALLTLGIPYALVLAIYGGVLEVIPYLGPILAAIPPILIGFLISPLKGLLVLGAYILIQQIENHIIVPQVMRKAVGLNPVTVILSLLIGVRLGGILGGILAVPLATALSVVLKDFMESNVPAVTKEAVK